jgi:hypothetical protein
MLRPRFHSSGFVLNYSEIRDFRIYIATEIVYDELGFISFNGVLVVMREPGLFRRPTPVYTTNLDEIDIKLGLIVTKILQGNKKSWPSMMGYTEKVPQHLLSFILRNVEN